MPPDFTSAPILCVVGARPNFMKIAPVIRAMKATVPPIPVRLVHTGQHYDPEMNAQYFQALGIPDPDINLEVGSASHAVQTAEVMRRFEPVLDREQPAAVLVVGDVNSTLACALVAVKKSIPVIHVEAGLRSLDRAMPEEINRVLTDHISTLLLCPTQASVACLEREGIREGVHHVGDVMYDATRFATDRAEQSSDILDELKVGHRNYGVATVHRQENTDSPERLKAVIAYLQEQARKHPVVLPLHPRTRQHAEHLPPPGMHGALPEPCEHLRCADITRRVRHGMGRGLCDQESPLLRELVPVGEPRGGADVHLEAGSVVCEARTE